MALAVVIAATGGFWPEVRKFAQRFESGRQPHGSLVEDQPPPPGQSTAGVATAAARERLETLAASGATSLLSQVANLSAEAMEVELSPSGQVLMTSKYLIQRLGAGNPNDRRVLFSPQLYREQIPDGEPQAMASALALPEERYLFGGWHGEVLYSADGQLRRIKGGAARPQGRIADLKSWRGEVLLAGDGLWRLSEDGRGLREIPLPGIGRIRALAPRGDQLLLAAGANTVYQWNGERALPWLRLPDDSGGIEMLLPAHDGGWWIGSTRGFYRASADGKQLETLLAGVWTTSVGERADELWVGTWKQGLLLRRDGRWYRLGAGAGGLADASVSGLVIDSEDHLWLSLYGGGGWQAELAPLRETLTRNPWLPVADSRE